MKSIRYTILRYFEVAILLVLLVSSSLAQNIPPRPSPPTPVNDLAGILDANEVAMLENKLRAYYDSTSTQVVILTVKSVGEYPMSDVAHKVLREWGVGEKGKDNGIVILVAIDDKKFRIETGYGMEGALPDLRCKRIADEVMRPAFRAGRYYDGLNGATSEIIRYASGEFDADPQSDDSGDFIMLLFILLAIAFFVYISYKSSTHDRTIVSRRGYSTWGGGGGWIYGGGGFGGGGGSDWGGGGGGGGFDFGGGDGGGGGADGDW